MLISRFRPGGSIVTVHTTPTYVSAGAGAEQNGASPLTPTYPGSLLAGDLFVLAATGYLSGITTPSGWQLVKSSLVDFGTTNSYLFVRDARATGSESGTFNVTITAGLRGNARMYAFRGAKVSPLDTPSDYFDTSQTAVSGTGAITNPSLSTSHGSQIKLACCAWMGYTTSGSISPTGTPSGGTWTEVAEYYGTTDIFAQELQTAGDVDISGGTTTFGGTNQGVGLPFYLIGS